MTEDLTLLLRRFSEGDDGRRRLMERLLQQSLVANDTVIAGEFAEELQLHAYETNSTIIVEGGLDNDLCFLLRGEASVVIRGQEVGRRFEGQHVGELAMVDSAYGRSATIRACCPTIVGRLPEEAFARIAKQHPELWKRLAVETARRLRSRASGVLPRNERPEVFIGSFASNEGLAIARAVQEAFRGDPWTTRIWTDGVFFGAGKTPLESLVAQIERLDFGLVVVTADDLVAHGGAARESLICQLGLLIGKLGRGRCFMLKVMDRDTPLQLPTDVPGVQPRAIPIAPGDASTLDVRVRPAVEELREVIRRDWSL